MADEQFQTNSSFKIPAINGTPPPPQKKGNKEKALRHSQKPLQQNQWPTAWRVAQVNTSQREGRVETEGAGRERDGLGGGERERWFEMIFAVACQFRLPSCSFVQLKQCHINQS